MVLWAKSETGRDSNILDMLDSPNIQDSPDIFDSLDIFDCPDIFPQKHTYQAYEIELKRLSTILRIERIEQIRTSPQTALQIACLATAGSSRLNQ